MLSDEVKNKLNKEDVDLSNYTTKEELQEALTDDSLLTDDKSLVGAINELFQSANNGKEIIADAIGEPLSAEDTFAAMGSGIKGLLSTFKTNMMNNGIAVEAGDKFKSLIDKIATMSEDGEGKGIQYVTGAKTTTTSTNGKSYTLVGGGGTLSLGRYLTISLDFEPALIVVKYYTSDAHYNTIYLQSEGQIFTSKTPASGNYCEKYEIVCDRSVTSNNKLFNLPVLADGTYDYYAIGVGEEDTTLRDSLASILEGEGVEVSEEDGMASLISKVDEEFDNKNANSGLDIISATELPAIGKENQICVITTGDVDNILVSNKTSDLTNTTNNVCVYLGEANSPFSGVHTVTSGNINVIYNIDRISYNNNNVNSYVYKEGQWGQLTQSSLVLMLGAAYVNTDYGSFPIGTGYDENTMSSTSSGILMSTTCSSYSSESLIWSSLPRPIDFGPFSKINASINVIESTRSSGEFYLLAFNSNTEINGSIYTSTMTDLAEDYTYVMISEDFTGNKTLTFDVSGLTGEYYLGIALLSNKNSDSGSYASSFHRAYLTDLSLQ